MTPMQIRYVTQPHNQRLSSIHRRASDIAKRWPFEEHIACALLMTYTEGDPRGLVRRNDNPMFTFTFMSSKDDSGRAGFHD